MPLNPHRVSSAWIASLMLVLAVGTVPAGAQEKPPETVPPHESGPPADLSIDTQAPDRTLRVGESLEMVLEVRNAGPEAAGGVVLGGWGAESLAISSSDPACSSDGYGGLSCSLGSLAVGALETIRVRVERVGARESWAGFSISSENQDPNYENNYSELYVEPDTSDPADVTVSIDAPADPPVGDRFQYRLSVTNLGPEDARAVVLRDSLPQGVTFLSWDSSNGSVSCAMEEQGYYGATPEESRSGYEYRELVCSVGTMAPDQRVVVTIDVERVDAFELWNSAWVTTSSYDAVYENDYAYVSTAPDASVTSDLSVSARGPAVTPLVDETFDVTFTVGNTGPATSRDVSLSGFFPDGLSFGSARTEASGAACSANGGYGEETSRDQPEPAPADGSVSSSPGGGTRDDGRFAAPSYFRGDGFNCSIGTLAPGDSVDVVVSLTRVRAGELWMTASVWSSNHDPDFEDSYGELRIAPDTSQPVDVGVVMTGPADAEVGETFELVMQVTNHGPRDARSVRLVHALPYGLDYVSSSVSDPALKCEFADGGGPYREAADASPSYWGYRELRCELGTMASGAAASVSASVTRTTEYEVWATSLVETASYDTDVENDHAAVTLPGERRGPCPLEPAGTARSDEIAVYDCPVKAGGGADSIVVQADSATRGVEVASGAGRDVITVNVTSSSEKARRIDVNTGPGPDTVMVVVAPGAGDAIVTVHTQGGDDLVNVDAGRLGSGLVVTIAGGKGSDSILSGGNGPGASSDGTDGYRLRGGGGADTLMGAHARDKLWGGGGKDLLDGGDGDDVLAGGPGRDTCRGGPGEDSLDSC